MKYPFRRQNPDRAFTLVEVMYSMTIGEWPEAKAQLRWRLSAAE